MIPQPFDEGWFVRKAGAAGAEPVGPVTVPYDAMLFERRDPETPNSHHTGFFPGGVYRYSKSFRAPERVARTQRHPRVRGRVHAVGGVRERPPRRRTSVGLRDLPRRARRPPRVRRRQPGRGRRAQRPDAEQPLVHRQRHLPPGAPPGRRPRSGDPRRAAVLDEVDRGHRRRSSRSSPRSSTTARSVARSCSRRP